MGWVSHLKDHGFTVRTTDVADVSPVKAEHGVPGRLPSCHTALVDGYVIEGHVPAPDIARLLEEGPRVAGLAVPGMPIGSPGMEVPGRPVESYDVIAFDRRGGAEVFSSHGP